ncbi:MAG: methylmalonyl-CoA mutase family protein [Candidatus Thermoplasmatota archaeon]|jgi:methylmalonyl-CoA mutase N-terminal domain/subunit|nr:methylmalonyl-CoA mutase family protein [Candidatus Sysuiplasma jiujiangense]MCL5252811.1 methylmalonyl-CoA mutase family protein [Candidatus Thermoplasmatota archaeon]
MASILSEAKAQSEKIEITASLDQWKRELYDRAVQEKNERRKRFYNLSWIEIDPLYTPDPDFNYDEKLGDPGKYPYTRGIHGNMYLGKLWTMRQFAGFGSAFETNRRFKYLLSHGETGLSVAFDYPTLYGYDTDDVHAEGEYGKCGVAVSSLENMKMLFRGIPLDRVSTSMTINGPASIIWAMYIAAAEAQGVPKKKLRGTIQNDVLKEYIAQKSFIFPPEPSMRLVVDTFEYGMKEVPLWNTISISGYHIREAGSTAVQELAFTLADGFEYVRRGIDRGLDPDLFVPRLSFFFNAHNDFFEEIAKYRAARRIWAREMKERFGILNEKAQKLRFHTQTAGCSLTAEQPQNNVVRVAIQAMAAVFGGTQSLHTNSLDEALALPTEKAVRIALRTQQIIAYESGIPNAVDPLGGAYYVEWLTDRLEEEAYHIFDEIDSYGGVVPAIEMGYFQKAITESSYRYQKEIERKERIVVGVNEYVIDEPLTVPTLKLDPAGEEKQIAGLRKLRKNRNQQKYRDAMDYLRKIAEGDGNTMPAIIGAVKAKATLGEIAGLLREVFGEYREQHII